MLNMFCILFVSAFVLSGLIISGKLFLLTTSLLFIYFLCFIVDLKKLRRFLNSSQFSKFDSILIFEDTYTGIVKSISTLISTSRAKLIKNIEEQNIKNTDIDIDSKKLKYREKISAILNNDTNTLEGLAKFSKDISGGDAVVLSVIKNDCIDEQFFLINEIDSFKDLFREVVDEIINKNFDLLGYKKVTECGLIGERFEKFGFKSFTLKIAKAQNELYLVWNGYRKNSATVIKLKNSEHFISALESEINANRKVIELSEQVKANINKKLAKTNFITHISHDIRSPLHNVKSIFSLLKEEYKDRNFQDNSIIDLIDAGKDNCETAEELVETLLDFSSLSQGQLKAKKTVFNLAVIVKSAVANFRYAAKEKGLDLQVLSPDLLPIEADKSHLKRIIQNLVSNAIKYTERGHVQIILSPVTDKKIGLKIMDTGKGMKSEEVSKLFTPFNRFHKEMADGIGLGLVLTKVLVELNGGNIKVASSSGNGTTFTIVLPATAKEVSFLELQKEENLQINSSLLLSTSLENNFIKPSKGKRILVLDDDIDYLKTIARSIESYGYEVLQSYSVDQAISIYNYEQPDFIISDLDVPSGGGERFLEYVQNNNYNPKPVVILSGKEDVKLKADLLTKGALAVLLKPTDTEELLSYFEEISEDSRIAI